MRGNVVISNNVIVDRKTSLDSCLILPDTYIGEMVDVHNAIMQGRTIIRVDTGARMNIVDRFLAADLKRESASKALGDIANRLRVFCCSCSPCRCGLWQRRPPCLRIHRVL